METIQGIDGLSEEQLQSQVARGGKFVMYQYCISIIFMTFRQNTRIYYLAPGEFGRAESIFPTLISFFLGWWGIPWGPIYTIGSITNNLRGGKDVTQEVMMSFGLVEAGKVEEYVAEQTAQTERKSLITTRFVAFLIDLAVVACIAMITYKLGLASGVYAGCAFLYFLLSELFAGGQTLGKKLLNIKTRMINSEETPDAMSLVIRTVVKSVSSVFPFIYLMPLFNKNQQSLHDYVAKTTVDVA